MDFEENRRKSPVFIVGMVVCIKNNGYKGKLSKYVSYAEKTAEIKKTTQSIKIENLSEIIRMPMKK